MRSVRSGGRLTLPSLVSRMLSLLMSRWMTPLEWRYSSALRQLFTTAAICSSRRLGGRGEGRGGEGRGGEGKGGEGRGGEGRGGEGRGGEGRGEEGRGGEERRGGDSITVFSKVLCTHTENYCGVYQNYTPHVTDVTLYV